MAVPIELEPPQGQVPRQVNALEAHAPVRNITSVSIRTQYNRRDLARS